MTSETIQWLLNAEEPWTRYGTLVDLLDRGEDDPEVSAARNEMLAHAKVRAMIAEAITWGDAPFKRHNDSGFPIYKFSTLADFGLRSTDPGMEEGIAALMAHQSPQGAFQTLVNIPKSFGGSGEDVWSWMLCDAPTQLYVLLVMGMGADERVQRGVDHLVNLVDEGGWRCIVSPDLGKFRGPGRKADPCPVANVYALKALSLVPDLLDSSATRTGVEMLLWHWQHQKERKVYLFGIGSDFRKLKYPYVWYNILHMVEVLSRFNFVHCDARFLQMVTEITAQADDQGRYTASSMYRPWKGWSFADKKHPSPWLTFLVLRMTKRLQE